METGCEGKLFYFFSLKRLSAEPGHPKADSLGKIVESFIHGSSVAAATGQFVANSKVAVAMTIIAAGAVNGFTGDFYIQFFKAVKVIHRSIVLRRLQV